MELFARLFDNLLCLTCKAEIEDQRRTRDHVFNHLHELRGHDLLCWCRAGQPCHADVLLELANANAAFPGSSSAHF